jgi:uncharacterized protein
MPTEFLGSDRQSFNRPEDFPNKDKNLFNDTKIYRRLISYRNLSSFSVKIGETDLFILADKYDSNISDIAYNSAFKYRRHIEEYISLHPQFQKSLVPLLYDDLAPDIIKEMLHCSNLAGVGPMASVAGAISQYVGTDLLKISKSVVVENGGDIFLNTVNDVTLGVFAGSSPLSEKIAIHIKKDDMPTGVCTSSGSIGHSLSFGRADAVCVLSKSAVLSDASATFIGNLVKKKDDIKKALEKGMSITGVQGILIVLGDAIGACGAVEIMEL